MMMSKGIILLEQMGIFNDDIRGWRQKSADLKTWEKYKLFSHQAHQEQKIAVKTAGKGGYTATVQKIYDAPTNSPEEHNEVIKDIQTIVQGMQTQGYNMEELAQFNLVLTSSNSTIMAQLAQMTVTMNPIQAQLKTPASAKTNQERLKIKFYCWSCGRNSTQGSKT